MDIFTSDYRGVKRITLASAKLSWDGNDDVPLFLTGVTIRYQQQSTPVYALNSGAKAGKYIIKGAPVGTMTCQGIVAESNTKLKTFFDKVGKTCQEAPNFTLTPSAGCDGQTKFDAYTLSGVDMDGIEISLAAGQQGVAVLNQTLTFSFTKLTIGESGGSRSTTGAAQPTSR